MLDAGLRPWTTRELIANPHPERLRPDASWLDQVLVGTYAAAATRLALARKPRRIVAPTLAYAAQFEALAVGELRQRAERLRGQLRRRGFRLELIAEAFALVREVCRRRLGMAHFPVQLMGGYAMLQGRLAEMATGEGKTLTAALAAATAALAGMRVHVITVNDYLAERDATHLRPVYEALGLSLGLVRHGQAPEERRAAYACDIVYGNNKEVTFDYLRDCIALGARRSAPRALINRLVGEGDPPAPLLLRGLYFALIDEADSVLVDEARTPLIISAQLGGPAPHADIYEQALKIARAFEDGRDFDLWPTERLVRLTEAGRRKARQVTAELEGYWRSQRAREELLEKALSALRLFHRDQHYIVGDGKVQIVDEYTGRVMADRQWEAGLHQLIEAKEGCARTGARETLAQITYQRFFRRYLWIGGMSGTAAEVARELGVVYGLRVVRIPTNRPVRRAHLGARVFTTAPAKWAAVVASARRIHEAGRPVLIGTRSVHASEHLGRLLDAAGLPHVILNARQDRDEAELIAAAGAAGRITVATNIAGRGTDIRLAPGVAERGGLHVILTEFHDSKRIDRQLYGRAGRQGDRGSAEAIASLQDELFTTFAPRLAALAARLSRGPGPLPRALGWLVQSAAQQRAERIHQRVRRETFRKSRELDKALAFANRPE